MDDRSRETRTAPTSGQVDAFEALYRATFDDVTRFAARRLREPEDVADAVAATFATAFASWDRFDPRRGPAIAWLFGIARNVIAGERRRRRQADRVARRVGVGDLVAPDEYERLAEVIDAVRLAPALERMLEDGLTEGERELLRLVCEDELSVADAGRVLDITPVAARMRLARVRRRVRRAMDGSDENIESLLRLGPTTRLAAAVRKDG